jgi:hypothetical protein
LIEPGGAEQRRDLVRSTQREHARSPDLPSELGELGVSADRIGDQHQPFVGVKSLPTHERGTASVVSACRMLVKARTGSSKNISPN